MHRTLGVAVMAVVSLATGCGIQSEYVDDDYSPPDRSYESPAPTGPPADYVPPMPEPEPADYVPEGYCIDVTSFDNNWDNDMLCTRSDGSQFYTSYEGAGQY